ncbi:MAG: hypothetical protein ACYDB1_06025 [Acidiferrobacteraceae bacterium]
MTRHTLRAGGHGGIWPEVWDPLRVRELADRFSIDAGLARDFVLRHLAFQEHQHRLFLLWLQDIHLPAPPSQSKKGAMMSCRHGTGYTGGLPRIDGVKMGDFQVAMGGGVWGHGSVLL